MYLLTYQSIFLPYLVLIRGRKVWGGCCCWGRHRESVLDICADGSFQPGCPRAPRIASQAHPEGEFGWRVLEGAARGGIL